MIQQQTKFMLLVKLSFVKRSIQIDLSYFEKMLFVSNDDCTIGP